MNHNPKLMLVTQCGSCKRVIQPIRDAEMCWFCGDDLCVGCWDLKGHCGHEAADAINALAAKGPVMQADIDKITGDCPVHGFKALAAAREQIPNK